ncbi:MAG: DUF4340 domain-containing protein [Spirochaetota bacterium]
MRFFRTAIILFSVIVVAGFAYWYFEVKREKEKKEQQEKQALLFERTDKEVKKIVIEKKEGQPVVMEKKTVEKAGEDQKAPQEKKEKQAEEGVEQAEQEEQQKQEKPEEKWVITSPVKTPADELTIESIIDKLKQGKREELVWEDLKKSSQYGLDQPQYTVKFIYEDEKNPRGIRFGKEALDGKRVFASLLGRDIIVAVSKDFRKALVKTLYELRDKRIAPYEPEQIKGVTMITGNSSFVLKKQKDEWYFMPDEIKASTTRVELFTGTLSHGSFVEVVHEKGRDMAKYGLNNPRMLLSFSLQDNSNYVFVVGDPIKENNAEFFYATRSTDGMIFKVKASTVNELAAKTKFELKDRHIFSGINEDDVNKFSLKYNGQDYTLVKDQEGNWVFQDTEQQVDRSWAVDSIVRNIVTAEYQETDPIARGEKGYNETGIGDAKYQAKLYFTTDREPLTVRFTDKKKDQKYICMTADGGKTVYYINSYFVSNIPETRKDWVE